MGNSSRGGEVTGGSTGEGQGSQSQGSKSCATCPAPSLDARGSLGDTGSGVSAADMIRPRGDASAHHCGNHGRGTSTAGGQCITTTRPCPALPAPLSTPRPLNVETHEARRPWPPGTTASALSLETDAATHGRAFDTHKAPLTEPLETRWGGSGATQRPRPGTDENHWFLWPELTESKGNLLRALSSFLPSLPPGSPP